VISQLLNGNVELLLAEATDLRLDLGILIEDLLTGDLGIDRLHVVVEGDGGLGADVSETKRVEHRVIGALHHTCESQSVAETFPATPRRTDCTGLTALRRIEPLVVSCNEGDHVLVDRAGLLGPGEPVLRVRGQVDRPEAVEEGRVHLVDGVGAAGVDGREDAGLGV